MKQSNRWLPAIAALMGAVAFALRLGLYVFGTDEKGLLVSGHPLEILLWLLTGAAAALVLLRVWKLGGSHSYYTNFPASVIPVIGCYAFSAGLGFTVMTQWHTASILELVRNVTSLLAIPALLCVSAFRKRGDQPCFLFHGAVCLALTLHTTSHYPGWSSCPQLQDSFFPIMGCIGLMLFAYYQTAFDVGLGSRRMQLGTGLLAAYACFAAIPGSETSLLYLTGGIWALTNLCVLTPTAEPTAETQKEDIQ